MVAQEILSEAMRIIYFDHDSNPPRLGDVETKLEMLAASPDRLSAIRWRKLLELVRLLGSGDSASTVGCVIEKTGLLLCGSSPGVGIEIWIDWPDAAPHHEGIPSSMHYRLQIRRLDKVLSEDFRSTSAMDTQKALRKALSGGAFNL